MNENDRLGKFLNLMDKHLNDDFIDWLRNKGFFIAPASVGHHGNYEGGLFDHSYMVAETLRDLTLKNGLKWKYEESPLIVGMFHDLCKIDAYVKTPDGWTYNNDILVPGHGEKSIILLQKFNSLNDEEITCIRWHMGAFDVKENWNYYSAAVRKYPNVLWTHTADMIASQVLGV